MTHNYFTLVLLIRHTPLSWPRWHASLAWRPGLYILRSLQKVRNSAAKRVFKSHRRDHVQLLLHYNQALHWLLVQARTDYKLSTVITSSLALPLHSSLTFYIHTIQTTSFFCRHRDTSHPPMLKLKPLANVLSLTVLQSNGILSLLTSITFSPPMPSKLTHLYKQYNWFQKLPFFLPPSKKKKKSPLQSTLVLYIFVAYVYICRPDVVQLILASQCDTAL